MREFDVKIRATITKVIRVTGENEEEAEEIAHQLFNPADDGTPEDYDQNTLDISEVKE